MKKNESGRTMVEIMGVIAIIGVLSVVGVWSYGTAMKKHKSNEIMREINVRANQVSSKLLIGGTIDSMDGFENAFLPIGECSFNAVAGPGANQFSIILNGTVPDEVCRQIYSEIGSNTALLAIGQSGDNYTSADDCEHQKARPSLYFVFNNDMSH